jgi:hypothetical protein
LRARREWRIIRVVPHYWIKVTANPKSPAEMRDAARSLATGVRLLGDELFFKPGDRKHGFATLDCADEDEARDFVEGLVAKGLQAEYQRVLTADEIDREQAGGGDCGGDNGYAEAD